MKDEHSSLFLEELTRLLVNQAKNKIASENSLSLYLDGIQAEVKIIQRLLSKDLENTVYSN